MNHRHARAVVDAWKSIADHNQNAALLVRMAETGPPDVLGDIVASLLRGLPRQWALLSELIARSADALNEVQADVDQTFAKIAAGETIDILDIINDRIYVQPGPRTMAAGLAPGGIVLNIYSTTGNLISSRAITDPQTAVHYAGEDAQRAADLIPDGQVVLVVYDGDTGARMTPEEWAHVLEEHTQVGPVPEIHADGPKKLNKALPLACTNHGTALMIYAEPIPTSCGGPGPCSFITGTEATEYWIKTHQRRTNR